MKYFGAEFHESLITTTCTVCNKDIKVEEAYKEKDDQFYCSPACYNALWEPRYYETTMTALTCSYCGADEWYEQIGVCGNCERMGA